MDSVQIAAQPAVECEHLRIKTKTEHVIEHQRNLVCVVGLRGFNIFDHRQIRPVGLPGKFVLLLCKFVYFFYHFLR